MNINSRLINNNFCNRGLSISPRPYSISRTFELIQDTADGIFRAFSSLTVLKFCPRKKQSISFSPNVTLTVFRRESPVVADKEQHALRMSLEFDYMRPVQVHYHLENLGYEEPIYDRKGRMRCKPCPSNQFDKMILKYYPTGKGLDIYLHFIQSVLLNAQSSETDLILALKAYVYIQIWNRVCRPKMKEQTGQRFSEWAMAEFPERFLEMVNFANDKQTLLDGIMQSMNERNVDHEDTYTLKEFMSCQRRRPGDLQSDPHYLQNCIDVQTERWGITEERIIRIKKWPSYLMDQFHATVDELNNDQQFEYILSKLIY
jgi:hypothetical protein